MTQQKPETILGAKVQEDRRLGQKKNNPGSGAGSKGKKPGSALKDMLGKEFALTSEALDAAQEVTTNPETIRNFISFVQSCDRYAVARLKTTGSEEAAMEDWLCRSRKEWESQFRVWAEDDESVRSEILPMLDALARPKNRIASNALWSAVEKFERPCGRVRTSGQLIKLLEELLNSGLVRKLLDQKELPEEAVSFRQKFHKVSYVPHSSISEGAWFIVQDAYKRTLAQAEQQKTRLEQMKQRATAGLNPKKVSEGQGGTLFLQVGINRGVLLSCQMINGEMRARIVESVGHYVKGGIPSAWTSWDNPYWPDEQIARAMQSWKNKMVEYGRQKQRLDELMDSADLPNDPAERSLTRMVKGEVNGTVAFYVKRFEYPYGKGESWFFAISLEGSGDQLKVIDVINANPGPDYRQTIDELAGTTLPCLEISGLDKEEESVRVLLPRDLPRMEREEYEALKAVCGLICLRLILEKKNGKSE